MRQFLLIFTLCAAGCSNYYVIRSESTVNALKDPRPEVIETPTYRATVTTVRTVALRAPDSCVSRTADASTGSGQSRETIMQTACGVEMAQIERGLAKKGYRVISWTVLNREMNTVGQTRSPIEVAAKLGAEVLFQINSLEKSRKNIGGTAKWDRVVYMSDRSGELKSKQPVTQATWNYLGPTFFEPMEQAYALNRRAVTLDASAVLVRTGESMWYYKWSHAEPYDNASAPSQFLGCRDGGNLGSKKESPERDFNQCQARRFPKQLTNKVPVPATAQQTGQMSIPATPADPDSALFTQLLDDVITDLIKSFSKPA